MYMYDSMYDNISKCDARMEELLAGLTQYAQHTMETPAGWTYVYSSLDAFNDGLQLCMIKLAMIL